MKKKKPNFAFRRKMAKIVIVIIIIIPIILINRVKIINAPLYLSNLKYSNIIDALFEYDYTKFEAKNILEKMIESKKISEKTENYILKLKSKGYNKNTANYVLVNLTEKEITSILSEPYNKDFEKYVTFELFDYKKYERYKKYQKENQQLSLKDVIVRIELNLDKEYYEDAKEEKNPDSMICLVNKYRYLREDYEPSDLVDMEDKYANNLYGSKKRLRKEAYEMFKKMVKDANKDDINFYAESAYRTYSYQEDIYKSYLRNYGKSEANKYAAVPGFSEHQTGLAIDLANTWTIKENSDEYKWIKKNAYKYGYIIRYKPDKVDITGFEAEAWHIRYVGKGAAKIISTKDITLDEYYILYNK